MTKGCGQMYFSSFFDRNFLICVVSSKKVTVPGPQFYFSETEQDELRFGLEF